MPNFGKELDEFHEWEIKQFVRTVLEDAHSTMENSGEKSLPGGQLLSKWTAMVESSRQRRLKAEACRNHIHVLFSLSDAGSMKVTLSNAGKRQESQVLAFDTLFSIGPLKGLESEEGQRRRSDWLTERFPCHLHVQHLNQDNRIDRIAAALADIPDHKKITIYCSDNAHDQIGLRFALFLLRHRPQPVHVVNVTQVYQEMADRYDRTSQPFAQGQVPFEALEEIIKQGERQPPLTDGLRTQYEQEWRDVSEQEGSLRLWLDGEIRNVPETYYDDTLLSIVERLQLAQGEECFIRAGRVVGEAMESWQQLIGDAFVDYRLWTLISQGKLEFSGLPGALYRYSVKLRH